MRLRERFVFPKQQPPEKKPAPDEDEDGVVARKRVGETLRGRLLFARALDEIDDALDRAFARQTSHSDDCLTLQVHGAAADRVADAF